MGMKDAVVIEIYEKIYRKGVIVNDRGTRDNVEINLIDQMMITFDSFKEIIDDADDVDEALMHHFKKYLKMGINEFEEGTRELYIKIHFEEIDAKGIE